MLLGEIICNVIKERWHHAVKNAFEIGGDAAHGQTGDLLCADCKYSGSPSEFERKSGSTKSQD